MSECNSLFHEISTRWCEQSLVTKCSQTFCPRWPRPTVRRARTYPQKFLIGLSTPWKCHIAKGEWKGTELFYARIRAWHPDWSAWTELDRRCKVLPVNEKICTASPVEIRYRHGNGTNHRCLLLVQGWVCIFWCVNFDFSQTIYLLIQSNLLTQWDYLDCLSPHWLQPRAEQDRMCGAEKSVTSHLTHCCQIGRMKCS